MPFLVPHPILPLDPPLRKAGRGTERSRAGRAPALSNRYVALCILVASGLGPCACAGESRAPSHIVLVSIDTLNRSALRAFNPGAQPLPELDAFAHRSVRLVDAVSTASWTLPAHASFLTGLLPERHGAVDRERGLALEVPTLGAMLQDQGFETVAFTGGGFLRRRYGLARGFERYDEWTAASRIGADVPLPDDGRSPERPTEAPFERAIAFLAGRPPGGPPLFLFVHTYAVHNYFLPGQRRDPPEQVPPERLRRGYRDCVVGTAECSDDEWNTLRRLYREELARLDTAFGRLLQALRASDLARRTALIVLSDHGEGFEPARGRIHHGGRLHADLVRIPLLVHVPGLRARSVDAPVSGVDLMPTVLDLLGIPAPPALDGRSFAAALRGESVPAARTRRASEHHFWWKAGARHELVNAPERLSIALIEEDGWYVRGPDGEELYDPASDPDQAHDRIAAGADPSPWRTRARAGAALSPDAPRVEQDPVHEEALRALGYVE